MTIDSKDFMAEAIRLSIESAQFGGGPFGAVIVCDGRIIGRGANQVTPSNDPTAHAEIVAIRAACRALGTFQLTGCELYASCEPCPMCLAAAYWARVDRIWFANTRQDAAGVGFDDEFLYEELMRSQDERRIPISQLMRDEAQAAFEAWKSKADRIEY